MSERTANGSDARPDRPARSPPVAMRDRVLASLRNLHRDDSGATATEYILILTLVVLPIALLYPMFMQMVKTYGTRMTQLIGLPFP